jgi:hypothetical protein
MEGRNNRKIGALEKLMIDTNVTLMNAFGSKDPAAAKVMDMAEMTILKKIDAIKNNGKSRKQNISIGIGGKKVIIYHPNGNKKYEGEFKNDRKNGKGTLTYESGSIYEGEFVDDQRTGKGVLYYANGNRYEGDFVDDQIVGKGVLYYASGNKYEGEWKNGKPDGKGVLYYANGNTYEGDFVDGKPYGKGTSYYPDGKVEHKGYFNEKGFFTKAMPMNAAFLKKAKLSDPKLDNHDQKKALLKYHRENQKKFRKIFK